MVDVSFLHDDELIKLGKVHSSELSDGYLMHLDQKLTPTPVPAPEPPKVETPKPQPPVVNVSVESDPAVGMALKALLGGIVDMGKPWKCEFTIERDSHGDISKFYAVGS